MQKGRAARRAFSRGRALQATRRHAWVQGLPGKAGRAKPAAGAGTAVEGVAVFLAAAREPVFAGVTACRQRREPGYCA